MSQGFAWGISLLGVIGQTVPDQRFGTLAHLSVIWKFDLVGLENGPLLIDGVLAFVVAKGFFAKQHLIEYDTCRPNVDFFANLWIFIIKRLRWQIPVSPDSLVAQCDFRMLIIYLPAQPEIQYLDLALTKHDILRLQIVVDNLGAQTTQVIKGSQYFFHNVLGSCLTQPLPFSDQIRQLRTLAVLQHNTNKIRGYLEYRQQLCNIGMLQFHVILVLSHNVVSQLGLEPRGLAYFNCHVFVFLQIISLVHFAESAFTQQFKDLVSVGQRGPGGSKFTSFLLIRDFKSFFVGRQLLSIVLHLSLLILKHLYQYLLFLMACVLAIAKHPLQLIYLIFAFLPKWPLSKHPA